jgi:hypothetical protein
MAGSTAVYVVLSAISLILLTVVSHRLAASSRRPGLPGHRVPVTGSRGP